MRHSSASLRSSLSLLVECGPPNAGSPPARSEWTSSTEPRTNLQEQLMEDADASHPARGLSPTPNPLTSMPLQTVSRSCSRDDGFTGIMVGRGRESRTHMLDGDQSLRLPRKVETGQVQCVALENIPSRRQPDPDWGFPREPSLPNSQPPAPPVGRAGTLFACFTT
jgi:hypothetical protein